MEMCMTTVGARYFPPAGPIAVPGGIWSQCPLTAPSRAHRLRAGSPFHRALSGALANLTGIDLPVTDRMRTSASEP
jgi:hypothetical protein